MTKPKQVTRIPKRPHAAAVRAGQASGRASRAYKPKGAKSEFWQRLRAAREYAQLTQEDVAKQIRPSISRSAYAYWEAENEDKRSQPTGEQIAQLCKIFKVSAEWMLDDLQSTDGLREYMQSKGRETLLDQPDPRIEARGRAFWTAVETMVLDENVKLAGHFNVAVKGGVLEMRAGFLFGKVLCGFANVHTDWRRTVAAEGAQLLAVERLLGRPHDKVLLVYAPQEIDKDHAAEYGRPLGIAVHPVTVPKDAARVLLGV